MFKGEAVQEVKTGVLCFMFMLSSLWRENNQPTAFDMQTGNVYLVK